MTPRHNFLQELPSLASTVANLRADKRFGQNFLIDEGLCDQIARAVPDEFDVFEIGPGPGGLTRALLAKNHHVTAVELDERMIRALFPLQELSEGKLVLRHDDARKITIESPAFLAGNLPFHVATELWLQWIKNPKNILGMVLMFQAEVAERLMAKPKEKSYGRLSIVSQYLFVIEPWLHVPSRCFVPPPKVDGMVILATPQIDIQERLVHLSALDLLIKQAFSARRKKLISNLRNTYSDPQALLEATHIDPNSRAEELSIEDYVRLLATIKKLP